MNKRDEGLIRKAESLPWAEAAELEEQAESAEARRAIHSIVMRRYHREEDMAGII